MNKRFRYLPAAAVGALASFSLAANAALPAGTETIFTGTATDAATAAGYAATLFAAIIAITVGFKLVKKLINKVT